MIAQYIKARMQYRVDFWISSVGMLLGNVMGVFSLWVLFKNIPSLQGWKYEELVFLYAFSLLAVTPLQIFFDNIWSLRNHVQQGTFIKYYFKPINMMFYYMAEMVDLKGFAQLVFALVILIVSSVNLGLVWTPLSVLAAIALLVSASFIMTGLLVIAASSAFWITNSFSVLSFFSRFRDYARYPVTIFNGFFRILFTYVIPIGFVAFFPCQAFIKPLDSGWQVWLTPGFGCGLFALGYLVWSRGTRAYSGTGS
jgi:ABC-2 type transport system permease protein